MTALGVSVTGLGGTLGGGLLAQLGERDRESADRIRQAAFFWEDEAIHIRGVQVSVPLGGCYNISRRRMLDALADSDAQAQRQLGVHPARPVM